MCGLHFSSDSVSFSSEGILGTSLSQLLLHLLLRAIHSGKTQNDPLLLLSHAWAFSFLDMVSPLNTFGVYSFFSNFLNFFTAEHMFRSLFNPSVYSLGENLLIRQKSSLEFAG